METTTAHVTGHAGNGHYGNVAPLPAGDVEARLEMNRARLRNRLLKDESGDQTGVWEHINEVTRQVAPVARDYVRRKPAISLAAAAAAGALMVRFKPWRALGGPILLGMVARQIVAATMARSNQILGTLLSARRTRRDPYDHYADTP